MKTYIIDVWHEQCDPITGAEKLLAFQRKWGAPLVIEGGTVGKSPIASLRRMEPELDIVESPADRDKLARAEPTAAAWRRGALLIPIGPEWAPPLIREFRNFTGKSSAAADRVDATAHAFNHLLDQVDLEEVQGERSSHAAIP